MISQEEIEYIQWREDTDAAEAKAVTRKAMADYAAAHPLLAAYLDSLADYSDSDREEINYSH